MDNFLLHIAKTVYKKYGKDLDKICIVFPNRRAGLFFRKYLSEITDQPIWAPACKTINELMQDLSDIQVSENLELVFELYKIFIKETRTTEGFDDFYYWGEMLLNDFDDIDKYLVAAGDLFQNLEDLKDLEDHFDYLSENQLEAIRTFWRNVNPARVGTHKTGFMKIWLALKIIYTQFRSVLLEKNKGYEGMIYREVADRIENNGELNLEYNVFILIGFNALNPCESLLFNYLQKRNVAEFYWDFDESYMNDEVHEAGYFIRKNIKRFPSPETGFSFRHLEAPGKKIVAISVPSDVGQAKLIPQVLQQIPKPDRANFHHTAIVLADEQLLMPVLYSIPPEISEINVTMGYPLRDTPLYGLVNHLIDLQKRKKQDSDGSDFFYHIPVLSILNHPYLTPRNISEIRELKVYIVNGNKSWVEGEIFRNDELLKMIFRRIDSPEEMADYLMEILLSLYNQLRTEDEEKINRPALHQEYIYHLYLAIQRLGNLIEDTEVTLNLDTFLKLLDKLVKNIKIPFTGEPLAGLQIMGILETRALDFENLILLSLNEGTLPGGQSLSSFIPYNLRRGFGLPTLEHQDSIYAYYFYRLIQRAENITLIYNSKTNGKSSGEMSRFITQLKFNPSIHLIEKELGFEIQIAEQRKILIEKNEGIIREMLKYTGETDIKTFLSPSSINNYLDCSLKFYFRYIAGLKEPDKISEEIDFQLFGNVLHKAINLLYEPLKGDVVNEDLMTGLLKDQNRIKNALEQSLVLEFNGSSVSGKRSGFGGRNLVIFEILKKYLYQILKVDKNYLPFTILHLEKNFTTRLNVPYLQQQIQVRLGGTIDRIDHANGEARIIDYKTGRGDLQYTGIEKLFLKGDHRRNKAVLQTFLYAFLVSGKLSDQIIVPGLYFIRDLYNEGFDYHIRNKQSGSQDSVIRDFNDVKKEFEEYLKLTVKDLFDPAIPFTQTEDEEICKTCPYKKICHR